MNFEDFGEKMGIHKIDHEIIEKVLCSLSIDYFCLDWNKMQQMYLSCKNLYEALFRLKWKHAISKMC